MIGASTKAALIGLGRSPGGYGIGTFLARELLNHPSVELQAVIGRDRDRLEASIRALNRRPDVRGKFSGQALLPQELDDFLDDSEVELLAICSPVGTHCDYVRQALTRCRHVLVEKPLLAIPGGSPLDNMHAAEELSNQALSRGLALMTNCQRKTVVPILRDHFQLADLFDTISVELHIGVGQRRLLSACELTSLNISHPLSILCALGADSSGDLAVCDCRAEEHTSRTRVEMTGTTRRGGRAVSFKIVLCQEESCAASYLLIGIDAQSWKVIVRAGQQGTSRTIVELENAHSANGNVLEFPDLLTLLVDDAIGIVRSGDANAAAAHTRASLELFKMQQSIERSCENAVRP